MIQIRSNKIRWSISALLALFILFGTFHNIFSLIGFALFLFMLVFFDRESILYQIFFILPMASIFKMSSSSQMFFTIIILIYLLFHFVIPRRATLFVVLFALYILIGQLMCDGINILRTIKLICNFLFLSSVLNSEVIINHKKVFLSYIVGNIVASVFGMLDSSFFKIHAYIGAKELSSNIAEDVNRFAGLYGDPNYYSIGLIISLCLIVILWHRKELNTFILILFSALLIYFLLQTYSKSAAFMLILPFSMLLYSLVKNKKYIMSILIVFLLITVVLLALKGYISILDIVIERIKISENASGEMDINTLTTGRAELWLMYVEYIVNDIKVALFGRGISAELLNEKAAHNTYLDILYYLGIVGGGLLVSVLAMISVQSRRVKTKRNFLNYCVLISIGIMYLFLSELFFFDPPFHIFLAFTVLNLSDNKVAISSGGLTDEQS